MILRTIDLSNHLTQFLKEVLKSIIFLGTSQVVQGLGLCAFTAVGLGLTPGWGTEILYVARHNQKEKKKKY